MVLIFVFCGVLFGDDGLNLYEKAKEFESKGEYENAMLYYKKSAEQSLQILPNSASNSQNELNDEQSLQAKNPQNLSNKEQIAVENDELSEFLGLRLYEPLYLVGAYDFGDKNGRDNQELKFQLSFRKPLFYDIFGLGESLSFAYTQTSWWQLWEESSPFRETNYRPEIFVDFPLDFGALKYFRMGVLHESNGKGGAESRSWNKAYLQTGFKFGALEITPRVWQSFVVAQENSDIGAYMGFMDLRLSYKYSDHRFSALLRNNLRFNSDNRGAVELNWMFPLFRSGVYGYLQYFSGYGESLIDYNRHVDKVGVGFTIFR